MAFLLWITTALSLGQAPAEAPVEQILRALPAGAGVCVHAGCGDGALMIQLAKRAPKLVIHGLEADPARVKTARAALAKQGLYGALSVERWTSSRLPYADHLVNVVIATDPDEAAEREILRVLAPDGTAWIRRDGKWASRKKPRPGEFGEWTHWRHGADGNMVSRDRVVAVPSGLRWVAGPAQDKGGQRWYYDHAMVTTGGRNFYTYEESIVARDAFNGVILWTRELRGRTYREQATPIPEGVKVKKRKRHHRPSKVRPVVSGDRLYAIGNGRLLALDTATGKTVADLCAVDEPLELLVDQDRIVLADKDAVRTFDAKTGKPAWEEKLASRRIVSSKGVVFCLSGGKVVALDLISGSRRWETEHPEVAVATTFTSGQGLLVVEKATWQDQANGCGILVFSGEDGSLLWKKDFAPDMTHYKEARAYLTGGFLWLQMSGSRIVAFDPKTGEQKKQWRSRGKHCAAPVATDRYFIAPECDFTDLASGEHTTNRMFKSACRFPFLPANGLLYTFPVQCECFPMLRGYMGLTSGPPPELDIANRLERTESAPSKALLKPDADEGAWPMYRHDVYRSGSTESKLGGTDLTLAWETKLARPPAEAFAIEWDGNPFVGGLLSSSVAAGGRLFVAHADRHRISALDAKSGTPAWTFTAGGRIDGPPTLSEGRCLFGSHDGWVYCLNAADGSLLWRFRAAPRASRMMAYGQMESPWPVPASVLVVDGKAFAAAGRHPQSDGGLRVVALDVATGKLLWEKVVRELPLKRWYGPRLESGKKVGLDFEPVDMLVKDGNKVSMSRWQFDPETGESNLAMGSVEYVVFGARRVPRGLWGYGIRQTKKVTPKPPAVFDREKMYVGREGDVALVVAGTTRLSAQADGTVRIGESRIKLPSAPVPDGMIVAYGKLFVSTVDGRILCLKKK